MKKRKTTIDIIFENFNLLSDADFKSWMLNNHDELKQMEQKQIVGFAEDYIDFVCYDEYDNEILYDKTCTEYFNELY